jgi:hypothetical protein
MSKKRLYGFEDYKKLVKEGYYPGMISEYEDETSIDDLDTGEEPAEEIEEEPMEEPAEEPAEEIEIEEEPMEEPAEEIEEEPAGEETMDFGSNDDEFHAYSKKMTFIAGVFDEYKTYLKTEEEGNSNQLTPAMKAKIDKAFNLLNDEM